MEKNFKDYIFLDKIKYVERKRTAMGDETCIFCDYSGDVLDSNDLCYCILNKFPYNPGHLLVITKRHVESFEDLTAEEHSACRNMIIKMLKILRTEYKPHGFNIGINLGEAAGASIRHFHMHLVPRYKSELGFMDVLASTRTIVEPLGKTFERLKRHIDKEKIT
ncbi:MAG: HIT family protein [Candidatus Helarchaeales archaeon]